MINVQEQDKEIVDKLISKQYFKSEDLPQILHFLKKYPEYLIQNEMFIGLVESAILGSIKDEEYATYAVSITKLLEVLLNRNLYIEYENLLYPYSDRIITWAILYNDKSEILNVISKIREYYLIAHTIKQLYKYNNLLLNDKEIVSYLTEVLVKPNPHKDIDSIKKIFKFIDSKSLDILKSAIMSTDAGKQLFDNYINKSKNPQSSINETIKPKKSNLEIIQDSITYNFTIEINDSMLETLSQLPDNLINKINSFVLKNDLNTNDHNKLLFYNFLCKLQNLTKIILALQIHLIEIINNESANLIIEFLIKANKGLDINQEAILDIYKKSNYFGDFEIFKKIANVGTTNLNLLYESKLFDFDQILEIFINKPLDVFLVDFIKNKNVSQEELLKLYNCLISLKELSTAPGTIFEYIECLLQNNKEILTKYISDFSSGKLPDIFYNKNLNRFISLIFDPEKNKQLNQKELNQIFFKINNLNKLKKYELPQNSYDESPFIENDFSRLFIQEHLYLFNPIKNILDKNKILLFICLNLNGKEIEFIKEYLNLTNKTIESIYHDTLKQDNLFFLKEEFKRSPSTSYYHELNLIKSFPEINNDLKLSKNFREYCIKNLRIIDACILLHNNFNINESNHSENLENVQKIISLYLNKKLDLSQNYVSDFIQSSKTLQEFDLNSIKDTLSKMKNNNIIKYFMKSRSKDIKDQLLKEYGEEASEIISESDLFSLLSKFTIIENKISNNKTLEQEDVIALKKLNTIMSMVSQYETLKQYYKLAKPKDKKLFNLNMKLDDYEFKVLGDLDPYAFQVGADTNCCQRIGGAGAAAAIDSFINPLAGVLVLYKNDNILSQSYFHYIPSDNGYILDNIEANDDNVKNLINGTLGSVYKEYAKRLKQKYPNISYIKVGLAYTKISTKEFKKISDKKDKRHFEWEDKYSDFDHKKHIDLLQPL